MNSKSTSEKSPNEVKGFKSVEEALRYESFPAAKSELYYSIGDIEVEDGHGGFVPARDLLDRVGTANFTAAEDVLSEMKAAVHSRAA
jgi:hypothetical protein